MIKLLWFFNCPLTGSFLVFFWKKRPDFSNFYGKDPVKGDPLAGNDGMYILSYLITFLINDNKDMISKK